MTTAAAKTIVVPLKEVPPGEGRTFEVEGLSLAIFHLRTGEVFATQANCPHRGGPLADGLVGGDSVICPLHAWKFDLRTGQPILGDCPIRTYPAVLDRQRGILVTISQTALS